jgi:hypothetical protein
VGVPRGADDPQGPIGREQAGSPAGHPDGALGGCPSQSSGHPQRAAGPGSAIFQGGTRPAASAVPVPEGHRSSLSEPTRLSALLAVDLAVSRCPSHGRFRSCLRPPQFCRAGTARAGWPAPGQGARHTDQEALTSLQPRPIEEPRGLGLPGAARRLRLFGRFGLVLPGRGSPVILALFARRSPWLLLGKVGAWLRHHSYRLIR